MFVTQVSLHSFIFYKYIDGVYVAVVGDSGDLPIFISMKTDIMSRAASKYLIFF